MEKVLITGASGYIALHCIVESLKNGFSVKASLRNMSREDEVRKAVKRETDDDNLEVCKLDLLDDEGWEEAAWDCDYLLHTASPFITYEPKDENELIKPAKEGTLRALRAANKAGIKKIVLTSSIAAIAYGHEKNIVTEDDWTDTTQDVGAYTKSKTLAEKAAWDFIKSKENNSMVMTTIHPGFVFGPLLSNDTKGASADLMIRIMTGKFPAIPAIYFTVADVRDIAMLHVKALKNKESDGRRLLTTSGEGYHMKKISKILNDDGFKKAPTSELPTLMLKLLAPFSAEMKNVLKNVKRGKYDADISLATKLFDWKPIPLKETISEMGTSLAQILDIKK